MNDSEEEHKSGKRPRQDSRLSNSPENESWNQEEFKGEVGGTIGTQKKKADKGSQDEVREANRPAENDNLEEAKG